MENPPKLVEFALPLHVRVLRLLNNKLWRDLCEIVGMSELAADDRFISQSMRARNQLELVEILQPIFRTRTAKQWCDLLDQKGIPCAPVNTYPEILLDEHVRAMDLVREVRLPNGANIKTVKFPIGVRGQQFEIRRPPPKLGEHNEEVFAQWSPK